MARNDAQTDLRDLLQAGYRYALSLTHHPEDAEDLIQHACVKILRAKGQIAEKPYLFVTIRNLFIDRGRKCSPVALDGDVLVEASHDHIADIERRSELEHLLARLKPVEREALFLNCVEGYSAAEIAKFTEQPRGTVLSHLSRAKQKLNPKPNRMEVK